MITWHSFMDVELISASEARQTADKVKKMRDAAKKMLNELSKDIADCANNGSHSLEIAGSNVRDYYFRDTLLAGLESRGYEAYYYRGMIYVRWDKAHIPTGEFETIDGNETKEDTCAGDAKQEQDETPECAESERPTDI